MASANKVEALFALLVDFLQPGSVLIVIGTGVWEVSHGRLAVGGLFVFITFLSQLYDPVRSLIRLASAAYAASTSAERIVDFLDQRLTAIDPEFPASLDRAPVDHLRCRLLPLSGPAGGRTQPDPFSGRARRNPGLVRASGSRKSTVAKLLLRFYDPAFGQILLDGRRLRDLRLRDLREIIAVLF